MLSKREISLPLALVLKNSNILSIFLSFFTISIYIYITILLEYIRVIVYKIFSIYKGLFNYLKGITSEFNNKR
jgi:hypothetical protein